MRALLVHRIQTDDWDIRDAAEAAGISIIHQELNLVEQLSAAANIFLGREIRGWLAAHATPLRQGEGLVTTQASPGPVAVPTP